MFRKPKDLVCQSMIKRKAMIVEPDVQWGLARRMILHWCWFLVAVVAVNVTLKVITSLNGEPVSALIQEALLEHVPMVATLIVLLPLFVRDTMKLSNRFAGPMFRLRTSLERLAAGEHVRPIKFRERDFWSSSAESFNRLRHRLASLQLVVDQLNRRPGAKTESEEQLADVSA